jgi:uncharacterized protein DUF559
MRGLRSGCPLGLVPRQGVRYRLGKDCRRLVTPIHPWQPHVGSERRCLGWSQQAREDLQCEQPAHEDARAARKPPPADPQLPHPLPSPGRPALAPQFPRKGENPHRFRPCGGYGNHKVESAKRASLETGARPAWRRLAPAAAALYDIGEERPGIVEVSVRRRGEHQRPGIKVRSRPSLPRHDVGTLNRIPITSPVRTMLDLATVLGPRRLERAVNEADKRDVIDPESLRRELQGRSGEPGVRPLRALLDRDTFVLSDEELERLFLPLALESGLPLPLTKQMVNGFEVDFYWPSLGLVVETDGWRYHRTPSAQSRDALRDQVHTASGLTPLRFSHHQVKHELAHVKRVGPRAAPPKPPATARPRCPAADRRPSRPGCGRR